MRLEPRAEKAVRAGHPWVFDRGIKEQNREGDAGELAVVYDRSDRFLAVGLYDPGSPIRLRVLHQGKAATIDRAWWIGKIGSALEKRASLPGQGTDGFRVLNGESEGFPGLVVDRYADTLVVKLYTAAWFPRWEEIEGLLREVLEPDFLVLRLSRNVTDAAARFGLREGFRGRVGEEVVVFEENAIRFESAVLHGQKTGFFLDQRENRERVGQMAGGREVLNLFSFSGGFSLYAAQGGAQSVTDLDISRHALEAAERNFLLNEHSVGSVPREQVKADAFEWLAQSERRFDLVVVDPPSLAKRERDREVAMGAYRRLNRMALSRLRPGGILVAASCTAHLAADEFFAMVRDVARRAGRSWTEEWTSRHAVDHPATFAEAEYLKAICLKLG